MSNMSTISVFSPPCFRRLLVCLFGAAALMFCASLSAAADTDEDENFVCPDYVMESFRNEGLASRDRMDASRMSAYTEFVGKCARAADENGRTILHDSIYYKNNGGFGEDVSVSDVVKFLIKNGADVNAKGAPVVVPGGVSAGSDMTPLHEAALVFDWESARLLLANGADPNAGAKYTFTYPSGYYRTYSNYTPLFAAIYDGGNVEMVKLLLDKGADKNAIRTLVTESGYTWQETPIDFTYSWLVDYDEGEVRGDCVDLTEAGPNGNAHMEILIAFGIPECAQVQDDDLSQKIADSIDVLNAAGAALAMAGNAAGFKRAHPLIDYNQNGGSFGFAWTVSDEYMLVGLDDTIGLTWSGDRWTVKSQLIGGDKLSSSLSAGWEITF